MSDFKIEWIDTYLCKNPMVIFDVGAFNGEDALQFKRRFPYASVYAFEADPRNFEKCKEIRSHGVNVSHKAVLDYTGETVFYSSGGRKEYEASGSALRPTAKQYSDFPEMTFQDVGKVPCITLWDFCHVEKISGIDLLHMDVQGAEAKVIKGMGFLRPLMIFLEKSESLHYEDAAQVSTLNQLMANLGYELVKELEFDNLYVYRGPVDSLHW